MNYQPAANHVQQSSNANTSADTRLERTASEINQFFMACIDRHASAMSSKRAVAMISGTKY